MKITCVAFLFSFLIQISTGVIRDDCACGQALMNKRIVNGVEVEPNKYPWMTVMLSSLGNQICGGSIISDRTILTAGHCMFYTTKQLETKWMVGVHSIQESKMSRTTLYYRTKSYEFHPNFKNSPIFDDYDMSIVTVDRPIVFDEDVKPICLPSPNDHQKYYNQKVKVAGWGKLSDERNAPVSDVLLETTVYLKTPATCRSMTELAGYNLNSMLCAYDVDTDACMGDSGGPLFMETSSPDRSRNILLGVVSFGEGCATDFPGIYAKVDEPITLDWIVHATEESRGNFCKDPLSGRRFWETISKWFGGEKTDKTEESKREDEQPESGEGKEESSENGDKEEASTSVVSNEDENGSTEVESAEKHDNYVYESEYGETEYGNGEVEGGRNSGEDDYKSFIEMESELVDSMKKDKDETESFAGNRRNAIYGYK